MLRQILIFLFIASLWQIALGQASNDCSYKPPREGETWCFYSNLKLEFHGGLVSQSNLPPVLPFGKGCASISDADGNLIMFSDGVNLWDKNANALSKTLDGSQSCTQSALIVPNPMLNGIYYIFTTQLPYPAPNPTKGLNYSTIDFSTASGLDTLDVKNLLNETPEKLTGVRHGNGHDFLVVAHGWNNNSFHAYKVTNSGVDTTVIISNMGMIHTGTPATRTSVGNMKLSVDGSKLALAISGADMVEWFDFDNRTGVVSNVRQIPSPDGGKPFGIEFSPDSRYLYFTSTNMTTNATNNLYQVDLDAGTAPVLINPLPLDMTALQLAVDGRIYVVRYKKSFMGVIENPNRPGTACNFDDQGLSLNTSMALIGLPDMIQSYFDIPAITYDTKCQGDDTYFTITNRANIDSVNWNFGDPGSGIANSDTALQAIHKFSNSGTYNVNVTEYYNSQSFISPATVVINPLPPKSFLSLGDGLPGIDSIPILPGSEINLDGGNFMKTYLWQNGSTSQTFKASEAGYYNVTIEDTNCCMQSDTIKLYLLDLIVPSAFSPNHDGLNDRFRVKGPTQGIDNYQFYIYNRWGQLLWQSNNFGDSWDGTFKGAECPMGVYTWVMRFGVSGDLLKVDKIIKRGVITLVK